MINRMKTSLKALVMTVFVLAFTLVFPAIAMAQGDTTEGLNIIQKILMAVPDWVEVLALFSVAFSALAAVTPTVRDDEWASGFRKFLAKLRRLLDMLGLSIGKANRQSKK